MNLRGCRAALGPGWRRLAWLALGLAWLAPCALAAAPAGGRPVAAHGARDGAIPAWTLSTLAPPDWTDDCCTYAAAIGVNFVLYQGEWTGKPQRVMVLNVWPRKLPSLAAEVQADRNRYRELDPAGKVDDLVLRHRTMACSGTVYAGSDKVDDVVVFCDPGVASGIRLSWSMSFDADDSRMRAVLDAFMRVVVATRYRAGTPPAASSSG